MKPRPVLCSSPGWRRELCVKICAGRDAKTHLQSTAEIPLSNVPTAQIGLCVLKCIDRLQHLPCKGRLTTTPAGINSILSTKYLSEKAFADVGFGTFLLVTWLRRNFSPLHLCLILIIEYLWVWLEALIRFAEELVCIFIICSSFKQFLLQ